MNSDAAVETGWYAVIRLPLNGLEVMVGGKLVPSHDGKIKIGFANQQAAAWLLQQLQLSLERGTAGGRPVLTGEVIHDEQAALPQRAAAGRGRELG